jgi:hypothetical protein
MNSRSTSIFKGPNVAKHLSLLHDKYVIVSAENAPINIVFVCKSQTVHRPTEFFLILICISDLTLFTHSERISKSSFSRFAHCLA